MTVDRNLLHELLPAIHRIRDSERGEPLRQLLEVLTEQVAVLDEQLAQLEDDLFVETAAPWVLPYIAELIGLHGLPGASGAGLTPRAEVANTIGYRRRKGTAAVLEQLARDVTTWPARAVEFFELLVATQHMNHVRPANESVASIRDADRLEWVSTPFEPALGIDRAPPDERAAADRWRRRERVALAHTVDVRRIGSRRGIGRYNIPNVGIFLWRLRAYPLTQSPLVPAEPGELRRFRLSPLGNDLRVYARPDAEVEITHLAEPINAPLPIGRRLLRRDLAMYWGEGRSLLVETIDGAGALVPVALADVAVCDLSDVDDGAGGTTWAHLPVAGITIDPVLGRVAFADDQLVPPRGTFHYGFSANIGGGEYARAARPLAAPPLVVAGSIANALNALPPDGGVVEILDSGRYPQTPAIDANGRIVELRAADKRRPAILLGGDLVIDGDVDGEAVLDGLLIAGGPVRVVGAGLRRLTLRHCTLVPGGALTTSGEPAQPGAVSLIVETPETRIEIESCILGGLRVHRDAEVSLRDSIVDAGEEGVACAGWPNDAEAAGTLRFEETTILGKLHVVTLALASNSIVLARVGEGDDAARWPGPVLVERRQAGCARFSYFPAGARTPRRYACQPPRDAEAAALRPVLTSERYADAGYCQLGVRTPDAVARGADDESEMGVFHDLFQPRRADYLRARLDEYLRFGLEAGIVFAS